ncbi:MAG: hypothetical protein WCH99_20300 [Verrucomicrobiota bacterium]
MNHTQRFLLSAVVLASIATVANAQSGYLVTERGADYKVLQKTSVENGTNHVHRYVELATGLNYTNAYGQLIESKEQIIILPTGGAAATQGRHQVYFPGDIYNGVLEVVTPDGQHLRSRPLGITYDDGSNTVFIATLKHAVGYLVSSNKVVYRDAFTDFKADLVCTYRRGGFESDVVFRQQPPAPGDYGLDADFSTLQMVTEFFDTQDPQQIPAASDEWYGLQDNTLKFGKLTMAEGQAFAFKTTDTNAPAADVTSTTPVYKHWLRLDDRTFLIEEVPVEYLADDLSGLPLTSKIDPKGKANFLFASHDHRFPPRHEFIADTNQIMLASGGFKPEPGVVLDYNEVDAGQTDFTFAGDTTYYISGNANLSGTTTFEAGTVLKFAANVGLSIDGWGNISCQTTSEKPMIMTAVDDDSVGEAIPGSTGSPSGYYASTVLSWTTYLYPITLSHARVSYAQTGLNLRQYNRQAVTLDDIQISHCYWGICEVSTARTTYLKNLLVQSAYLGIQVDGTSFLIQNVTFNNLTYAMGRLSGNVNLKNCILADVWMQLPSWAVGNCNGFYNSQDFDNDGQSFASQTYPFQTGAAGNAYLTAASGFRDVGTTAINSSLLAELHTTTTYAPQDGGFPDTNMLDLGYHYPVNEDSDHDGLPDWWEYYWFGNYSHTGSELDASGDTLLSDYQNGIDPNIIQFSIQVANNYVNNSNPNLHLNVAAGTPFYYTVQVDNTNYSATTNWTAYTSADISANIGSLQGWHELWVGLKGRANNSFQSWQWKRLKLDFTPPTLTITSPTNNTLDVPMIQVNGYSPEPLASFTFDVSNTVACVTNQMGGVTDQHYDTNTWEFTTNYFECLDIPLTNGLNVITLHATDLAGNVTVTNFYFTLDYSGKTNPPQVQITWPQNGTKVNGSSFTLDGFVADPTVRLAAQIVSTNNTTNTVSALVERNGRFWVDNLPLSGGTNALTLTATDAAGNITTTNISIIQSSITLAMNPVTPASDLWKPTVNLTGIISDPTQAVWVNGVKGHNNGDGTWFANNVPTTPGGVASFTMIGYEPDEPQPDGSFGNP